MSARKSKRERIRQSKLPAKASKGQLSIQASLAGDAALKIFVSEEGWYRITRAEMALLTQHAAEVVAEVAVDLEEVGAALHLALQPVVADAVRREVHSESSESSP
mgnify:CR=1 FL=1